VTADAPADAPGPTKQAPRPSSDPVKHGRLRRFWAFLRPFRRTIVLLFASILFTILVNLPTPWCEKIIIDDAIPHGDYRLLLIMTSVIVGLFALFRLVVFFRGVISVRMRQRVLTDVRMRMYEHLQQMSLGYFGKNPVGALLNRITSDVGYVQNLLNDELFEVIASAVRVLVVLGLLFAINVKLTLLCMAVVPVITLIFFVFKKRVYRRTLELQQTQAELAGQIQQNFAGMKLIQAETAEARVRDATLEASRQLERVGVRRETLGVTGNLLTTVLSYLPLIAILWGVGGYMVIHKTLTLGELLAFTQYLLGLVAPVTRFFEFNMNLQGGYAALDRIYEVLDEPPEIQDEADAEELAPPVQSLALEGVTLRFAAGEGEITALRGVSFAVQRGEKVALVGTTGSGKTSVLHLLLRFHDPSEGRVLINGRPAACFTLRSLRGRLAYLAQEVFLFGASVRDNLTLGRDLDEPELRRALKLAEAHDLVDSLEGQLDARVDEAGSNFSGGERQRLALTRALSREAEVYLLDEATAALDPGTEQKIVQNLRHFLKDRTALIVAHRLSTLELVDRVLVFAGGRLVEQGRPEELLQAGGMLAALYRARGGEEEGSEP
jgi:ABC-type multidrug transport system fused ATPase/permease subunit